MKHYGEREADRDVRAPHGGREAGGEARGLHGERREADRDVRAPHGGREADRDVRAPHGGREAGGEGGAPHGGRAIVVTTSSGSTPELVARAEVWAARLEAPLVAREESLPKLAARYGATGFVVVGPERVTYHEPATGLEYFFHPGMSKVRLHNCKRGHDDPMLQAMGLQEGERVLDCTLGRAADAVIAAWKVGPEGLVRGLEKSRILAELTIEGLQRYVDPSAELTRLLRRIEALWADYNEYLAACEAGSFDVVYFDPIFDQPLEKSQAMAPLRALADASPLTREALEEARRVARKRVVIKQRKGSGLWEELGIETVHASPAGRVEYGIVEAE